MQTKLNMTRPELGWLSKVKLFDSERPRPVEKSRYADVNLPEPPRDVSPESLPPIVQDSLNKTKGRIV
jgi:hypothetical protein